MTVPVKFILGQEEKTTDPLVQVEFPVDAPAKAGVYEFQLVVVDSAGVSSPPATIKLVLQGEARAVLRVVNADGKPLDQTIFQLGSTVFLSAAESGSENGPVQNFIWRLSARP